MLMYFDFQFLIFLGWSSVQFKEHDTVERICRALIEVVESNLDKDLIEHSWRKSAFKLNPINTGGGKKRPRTSVWPKSRPQGG